MKNPLLDQLCLLQMDYLIKTYGCTVAAGPEGFEPPTTWLKARRST